MSLHLPLPAGYTLATPLPTPPRSPLPGAGGEGPPPRIPVGPLLSGPLHTLTGTRGQTVHIHRHAYRTTRPDDAAWTAHGYAYRCTHCRTIAGAHDTYTPTLRDAEHHHCPREEDR